MLIYFNPECSKCQSAVAILEENNCEFEIRNYLEESPSVKELKELVALLNCHPMDITRQKEILFIEKYADLKLSDEELYLVLSENPVLIERPIIIDGKKAIIGRPVERVLELIRA